MKINREELKKALEIVKPGLTNKEVIEQTNSFAFLGDKVVTYNDEISVSYPIKGLDLTGAVKANELYQLLGKIKKDEIELEVSENEILLTCGKIKAGLRLQSEITLPLKEIEQREKWKKLSSDFISALQFTVGTCSTDLSKPILNCVHIIKNRAESTNNYSIIQYLMDSDFPLNEVSLPANSVKEVIKLKPVEIAKGSGWIHFKTEQNAVLSCRVYDEKFPDVTPHLNVKGTEITIPKIIDEMLDRVSVFTKDTLEKDVEVEIQNNRFTVKGQSETGWLSEEANIKYNSDPLLFNIFPDLLKNVITKSPTGVVSNTKIKFESEKWCFISLLKTKSNK